LEIRNEMKGKKNRRGGRSLRRGEKIRLRAKVKGRGSARRPPSGRKSFFRKAEVTAEAVTYKATAGEKDERVGGAIASRGMIRWRARLRRQFQISEFQISDGQRRREQEATAGPSTALGMTAFRDEGKKSHWKFEMKIEAKEPARRPSKLRASRRRYGMAVSVSTSAGSWSCLLDG
jgi:hypothetical protein